MKAYIQTYTALFFIIIAINNVSVLAESTLPVIYNLPSSPIQQQQTKSLSHNKLLLCLAGSGVDKGKVLQLNSHIKEKNQALSPIIT